MEAGPVGISLDRSALGPVGMAKCPFCPFVDCSGRSLAGWERPLLSLFDDELAAAFRASSVLSFSSSASFARFSSASFSRCAFDRNLG